jgi:hypothetical protein
MQFTMHQVEKPARSEQERLLTSVVFNDGPKHLDATIVAMSHYDGISSIKLSQNLRPVVWLVIWQTLKHRIFALLRHGVIHRLLQPHR